MPDVTTSAVVPADAEAVWRVVRDFDALPTWHTAISASELEDGARGDQVGAVRHLRLADGGAVREQLVALDDRERRLTYSILESPFPVQDYRSTMRVEPVTVTGECVVTWSVLFDCDVAEAERLSTLFGRDVFGTGLSDLVSYFSPGE
jgi:Polyketide cyclase / dehydrase and lipid transport